MYSVSLRLIHPTCDFLKMGNRSSAKKAPNLRKGNITNVFVKIDILG